jgi:hypothetical protein
MHLRGRGRCHRFTFQDGDNDYRNGCLWDLFVWPKKHACNSFGELRDFAHWFGFTDQVRQFENGARLVFIFFFRVGLFARAWFACNPSLDKVSDVTLNLRATSKRRTPDSRAARARAISTGLSVSFRFLAGIRFPVRIAQIPDANRHREPFSFFP